MFKKWIGIENHYRDNFILNMFAHNPDLLDETFEITEKIDGANFSIICNNDFTGKVGFAKRSGPILPDSSFFHYQSMIERKEMKDFINFWNSYCVKNDISLQFVGELFGPGINGRINYGKEVQWRWYAIHKYDKNSIENSSTLLTYYEEYKLFSLIDYDSEGSNAITKLKVPRYSLFKIKSVSGFQRLLSDMNIHCDSYLTPEGVKEGTNLMEGVVIRPIGKNYFSPVHDMFIIKKKNPEFSDSKGRSKESKEALVLPEGITNIFSQAINYVNQNRTTDLFSKYGEIERPQQIGSYIKLYYEDVIADIEKDFPDILVWEKDVRKLLNKSLSRQIVGELQNAM